MEPGPSVTFVQQAPIQSLSINQADLRKLLEKVQERCWAAADIEIARYKPVDLESATIEKNRGDIREGFRLFVTVAGVDGTELHGGVEHIFDSPNLPSDIKSVFFDSGTPLRNRNYYVANRCKMFLDFGRPGVFDFSLMPSQATPNASSVEVSGLDATWVNGVFHEVATFARERSAMTSWLHRHSIYDVLLWLIGFPLSFWICYRAAGLLDAVFRNAFVRAAAYLYVFMLGLFGIRILFHYARWIWPRVEYQSSRNRTLPHKLLWGSISLGVVGNLAYDLLKRLAG
jgi:hypothetical protein